MILHHLSLDTAARAPDPSPLCGGGCPAERGGRGDAASGDVATVMTGAPWISVALPLSRLAPLATLPRRGGRVDARHSGGTNS